MHVKRHQFFINDYQLVSNNLVYSNIEYASEYLGYVKKHLNLLLSQYNFADFVFRLNDYPYLGWLIAVAKFTRNKTVPEVISKGFCIYEMECKILQNTLYLNPAYQDVMKNTNMDNTHMHKEYIEIHKKLSDILAKIQNANDEERAQLCPKFKEYYCKAIYKIGSKIAYYRMIDELRGMQRKKYFILSINNIPIYGAYSYDDKLIGIRLNLMTLCAFAYLVSIEELFAIYKDNVSSIPKNLIYTQFGVHILLVMAWYQLDRAMGFAYYKSEVCQTISSMNCDTQYDISEQAISNYAIQLLEEIAPQLTSARGYAILHDHDKADFFKYHIIEHNDEWHSIDSTSRMINISIFIFTAYQASMNNQSICVIGVYNETLPQFYPFDRVKHSGVYYYREHYYMPNYLDHGIYPEQVAALYKILSSNHTLINKFVIKLNNFVLSMIDNHKKINIQINNEQNDVESNKHIEVYAANNIYYLVQAEVLERR